MASQDMRFYETFYGVELNDWDFTWGTFTAHHKLLRTEYVSDACSVVTSSSATLTNEFLFETYYKKTYFIEGVIKGQITLVSSETTSHVTDYKVTIGRMNSDNTKKELFTTGWKTVNFDLAWYAAYNVGEERVIDFSIDANEKATLNSNDRIYVSVVVRGDNTVRLAHDNNATWQDLRVEIPFIL